MCMAFFSILGVLLAPDILASLDFAIREFAENATSPLASTIRGWFREPSPPRTPLSRHLWLIIREFIGKSDHSTCVHYI